MLIITVSLVVMGVMALFSHYPSETLGWRVQARATEMMIPRLHVRPDGTQPTLDLSEGQQMWFTAFPTQMQYQVLDEQGATVLGSVPDPIRFTSISLPATDASDRVAAYANGELFHVETVSFALNGRRYFMQTAFSNRLTRVYVEERLRPIRSVAGIVLIISVLIFAISMRFTFNRMLRPLRTLSEQAGKITPRNLATRLSDQEIPKEVQPLIQSFNGVLDRLERGFNNQQRFLASTVHELQTPLTLIRGQIEVPEFARNQQQLLADVDLMSRQVRQLLHLAEVTEPRNYQMNVVDLTETVRSVVDFLSRHAMDEQVRIDVHEHVTALLVECDKSAVFILLKNLVENAVAAAPAHSTVVIDVNEQSISVTDDGPGIRQEHLPHIFTRFWRGPDSVHDGAGLGLAICRQIAVEHDWHLFLDQFKLETCFVIAFAPNAAVSAQRVA